MAVCYPYNVLEVKKNMVWISHRPTENMLFPIEKEVANCIFGGFFKLALYY